jgi:putative DNA primase/helicase
MNMPDVLSHFRGVRRCGSGHMALCPAHPDKNQSLKIDERDGKILFFCHAGCTVEAICAAAGLEMKDLFLDAGDGKRIAATYDYTDEHAVFLYQVVRYEPKGFLQRQPDGKGGWTWSLKAVRRVLYRLPEVLAAQFLLLCEGEKDCETARALGIVATCNPGGAGKWRGEYSVCLSGKRVAIIADADEPGRKHAQIVAASLFGKMASLKVLELPGAKDLSEWVEHGGTREQLRQIIGSTPEWKPSTTTAERTDEFNLATLGELLDRPETETEWLWQGRLAAGTVSAVVSKPKVGKSTFARNLALAVSRGEPFLGMPTKRGLVVYLALEERAEDVTADFRAMGATRDDQILIHADRAPASGILAAVDLVRERKPALVVIDPLFRLAHIKDEKAYAETYAALGPLIDAARASCTHVLVLHHSGKSAKADPIDSPLGSTALGGAVSTLIVLRRTENYRLIQTVQRLGQDLPDTVLRFDQETKQLSLGASKLDTDRGECEKRILEFLDGREPQTQAQIREEVNGETRAIRAALTALVAAKEVQKTGEGTRGKPFVYEFWFGGSQDSAKTSKPESEKVPHPRVNIAEKVVRASEQKSFLVPDAGEVQKPAVSGVESGADALDF